MESFISKIRDEGEIRVLSNRDTHRASQVEVFPVITTDCTIGVQLQGRSSGKSFMIAISTPEEIQQLIIQLQHAFSIANKANNILLDLLEEKSHA